MRPFHLPAVRMRAVRFGWLAVLAGVAAGSARAQTMQAPDLTRNETLYVVNYAHLDTQWRWEMPQTISEYLLKTMRTNFDYFDKYPHYIFNWTGSNRYRLQKEYFPDDYARMKAYIAAGRWFPAGSSVEEGDVNLPSAEGIFRQVLYGNAYFRKEFGKASNEYMLPDCFGFPASLPTILVHSGVKGFSSQKLSATWQPAPKVGGPDSPEQTPEGIPFNVGMWVGPDGSRILSALNPGAYSSRTYVDLSKANPPMSIVEVSPTEAEMMTAAQKEALRRLYERHEPNWVDRININGRLTGVFADYKYVGTGDIGGGPDEDSVKLLEAIVTKSETVLPLPPSVDFLKASPSHKSAPVRVGEGPVHVIESNADQMFLDIKPEMTAKMPSYKGDLELVNHSAGSLTSQAYHKRWVTQNELLADAAEKNALAASWLGAQAYPQQRLNDAWILALGGHFHDTGAGTATPKTYEYAWNDDVIVGNQFGAVMTSALADVASVLDTRGAGEPLVVFNALEIDREDTVQAKLPAALKGGGAVRVTGPGGKEVASQVVGDTVVFGAKTPSAGYAVYHVARAETVKSSELSVSTTGLENARYRVQINADGDVASIFDKSVKKELLSAPIRLALTMDTPKIYPAWNMEYEQVEGTPRAYVKGPAKIRVKENGPARVAVEIAREFEGSKYVQTVSLAAGDAGSRVEFANAIDWRGKAENLKVAFPLTAANVNATYNEDVGTVERPNAQERQFEVFSHRWIDLTDKSGAFGVTILSDCKNASDKPSDNTVRLTLLRSPGISANSKNYTDQANQDWGHHEFSFGLAGHAGGWREAGTDWQGHRLNNPLRAFWTSAHPGKMGQEFSLVRVSNSRVRILAMKKAEDSDETVVRLVELDGKPANDVKVTFAAPVASAREINAQEQPVGNGVVKGGALVTSFTGYQPRTFALKMAKMPVRATADSSASVALPYDLSVASNDDTKTVGGGFDGKGNTLPAEMLPERLTVDGVEFKLAAGATGAKNAVSAKGQTIALPAGRYNRVVILAASAAGDVATEFKVGEQSVPFTIQSWNGFIGQWDTRVWKGEDKRDWAISAHHAVWPGDNLAEKEKRPPLTKYPENYVGLREGYVKPAELAWYASHHHTAEGLNQPYEFSYLFAYTAEVPAGAKTITLPNDPNVRIMAISVAQANPRVTAAQPLFDALQHDGPTK